MVEKEPVLLKSRLLHIEMLYVDTKKATMERVLVQEKCTNILSYNTMQWLGTMNERPYGDNQNITFTMMTMITEKKNLHVRLPGTK